MPASLLRLTSVTKSFGTVLALKDVSFDLMPGEVHALVGENGAGKSTLVQVITGAQRLDQGTIEINGRPIGHLSPGRMKQLGVACVYQHPALFPDLTIAENIGLRLENPSVFQRIQWSKRFERARELLRRIGTDIDPQKKVRELSMPQQQLVEIACALGTEARVVIMDEPTASLTQREQHLLFAVVRQLREQGTGLLYVSHRLEEVFALADRITVLRDGVAVRTCPVTDLNESSLIRLMVGRNVSLPISSSSPSAGPTVLSLDNVGCSESGLCNISFDLHAGEILGLAGLVGAGRTELARTLFGLTPADTGQIRLSGKNQFIDSPGKAVRQGIGYVPEDRLRHGVISELPLEQNITMASHHRVFAGGWLRASAERRMAQEYVQALDVTPPIPEAPASSLSGGNQQKISVARWLATQPKVLILDEPTQGVDIGAKIEIHNIIQGLARKGLAVLLISSDLPELVALSHRIGVMRSGRLIAMLPGHSEPHDIMAAAFGQNSASS
jgi:rhamnose transport system ATP-binding protein